MGIEEKLDSKIKELETLIKSRDNNDEWLNTMREEQGNDNEYFWFFCGEKERYKGIVDGLKESLRLIKTEGR